MFGGFGGQDLLQLAIFSSLGAPELLIILILVLVLFGAKKIPDIMRGIGEGMREFRKASSEASEEFKKLADDKPETEDQHKEYQG
jgi:sec-independent protein translocase protein TatA